MQLLKHAENALYAIPYTTYIQPVANHNKVLHDEDCNRTIAVRDCTVVVNLNRTLLGRGPSDACARGCVRT